MEFTQRYRNLNAAQKQAVDTIEGPVMVVAGPGTGKTELLSIRVANILAKTDTLPENILCLTFTESGAAAMRERLIGVIGKDAYKVAIHTFHSFGTETINQNREFFYNGALFEPASDLTRYQILRTLFQDLSHDNPLASTMNGEYTYQSDTARVIAELKRSGLTSAELLTILERNEVTLDQVERLVIPIFDKTVSKSTASALASVMPDIRDLANQSETHYEVTPLIDVIHDNLFAVLSDAETVHPTKPLSAWKKAWLAKDKTGALVFKSRGALAKLRSVAHLYETYLRHMEQAGLYDYDDMILQLVHAVEVHPDLKFNLQEKYLYILVDEFQDTNLAQMRILHNLTDNPVNEGRPNLMVVGDDDQAIYSFQGADISNILRFQELYPSAALIPLTDNYRSRAGILEQARRVITQGNDRLEQRLPALNKQLTPHHDGEATVELVQAPTIQAERQWLVATIAQQLDKGVMPGDIAVLTRHHREISALLPYFTQADIAVSYERQDNALDEPAMLILELLSRVVVALAHSDHEQANALLPELLAHPAWHITPESLWRLSSDAYDSRRRWLDIMETTPEFVDLHGWLVGLAQASLNESLEQLLDRMIGKPAENGETPTSLLHEYFFSEQELANNPSRYLDHLTTLQTIRQHLREHARSHTPTLTHFVEFIALHRRLELRIPLTRTIGDEAGAVHLMTAHKSKGLEFPLVFVLNSVDSVWGEKARSRGRLIGYPENLPLAPAGDSADERLRLFYVAATRAKQALFISFSLLDDSGRSTLPASFLSEQAAQPIDIPTDTALTTAAAERAWYTPYVAPNETLEQLLAPSLARYKLSVTHLNTFIDLLNGGPQAFLLGNLLHFPQAKTAASGYGSAVHRTLQQAHLHLSQHGERKPLEDILHDFEEQLARERLSETDYAFYLQKGSEHLSNFFTQRYDTFSPDQKAELDFKHQEVHIGDAHVTGMIDVALLDTKERTMQVVDYKTGKPSEGTARSEYEKVKLHKYRQQLLFYKLLVEGSRDYSTYTVTDARLTFVEPNSRGDVTDLPIDASSEELAHLTQLITAVWHRITSLDLPDTSGFESNLKGIRAFEQALIDNTI